MTRGFPLYGPGAHWIDRVAAGTVTFAATADIVVDLNGDGEADLTVRVSGRTTVARSRAYNADPTNPHHRNRVDLEIVDLVLESDGVRFQAGDGLGNFAADGPLASIGSSTEIADTPAAHDDFAIYFDGTIGGVPLHNREPLHMVASIDQLPPIGNTFTMDGGPLALLNAAEEVTGIQILAVTYVPAALSE